MILRRVIEHVKAQNWTAVALDFVIVVLGVFIGIQVSNWNDALDERDLEERYLERISADLRYDIENFQNLTDIFTIKKEMILALRDDDVDEIMAREESELILALNYTAWIALPAVRRATFDELLGAGNLTLVQNLELRDALSRYYAEYLLLADINAEPVGDYRKLFFEKIPGEVDLPIEPGDIDVDMAMLREGVVRLQADPNFEDAANAEIRYADHMNRWLATFSRSASELVTMLEEEG